MSETRANLAEPIYSELAQDDPDFEDIVELFVEGLSDRLADMKKALEKNDLDSLRQLAHQLKGSGGGHGYPQLTDMASDLEIQAREGLLDYAKRDIEELATLISRVRVLPH